MTRPTLSDLFGEGCDCLGGPLQQALDDGYVRTQTHPDLPLTIYNYTEKAAYEAAWTPVTLACRGLIVDAAGSILARPFRKFFNYGQTGAPTFDLTGKAVVTDKLDGSLGILYPTPDGHAIATRGSFASEQAIRATRIWRDRYAHLYGPPSDFTLLFEIVYPENRIVCDYGDLDDLLLLGAVHIESGLTAGPNAIDWPGLRTTVFPYETLAEALAVEPRPNAEGLVVHLLDVDERIKIKQEDYVKLHRIVTGLNARTVWEHLCSGAPLADLIEPLPDEFHPWVLSIVDGIGAGVAAELERLDGCYRATVAQMPEEWDPDTRDGRKVYAAVAAGDPDSWALFAQLDGRPLHGELLKRAKPEPYITPSGRIFTEDNA